MDTHVLDQLDDDRVAGAVETLKVLADETRLKLLWALQEGERSVGQLAELVDASPSAVSQHLARLRFARMVRTRRDGNRIYYSAHDDHVLWLVHQALSHVDHVTTDATTDATHVHTRATGKSRSAT